MLFKFIERGHFDNFFETGCLRLGTIYDFKDIIGHGVSRGDTSEGEHHLIRGIDETVTISKDKHEPIISEIFKMEGQGSLTFKDLSIVVPRRCEDAFIFCTSYLFNEGLFRDWFRENNLDTCYVINDVRSFIYEISQVISSSAFFHSNSNIIYTEERIDYQSKYADVNPAFTKLKSEYCWQFENRTVWGVRGPCGSLSPWVIYVPKAIKYCKPLAYLNNGKISYGSV
ncbi:hypothetical protein [Candidatus Nitrotoga sp. M5]|uniref:hypothetical protein n=1 Tax=Candidatus Nitrotoga sp. M5 TaxID=2890409 RepID=UPI001EF66CF1|nr:hypothetical protein [Candidatus Nitrotoga sp. M5]CAH1387788.1 conserved hypothetical protein [Candidatus Nitrotoga sp. M5]